MQDKNKGAEDLGRRSPLWSLLARGSWRTVLTVAACTAVCFAMHPFFDLPNLIMVYLLGSIYIAIRCGLTQALLSCLLGVLAFDFFFVPPHFGMTFSDTQYLFTVATMFIVAVVISRLTAHIRRQAESARAREQRAQVMLALTRELAAARGADRLLGIAAEQIARLYGFRAQAFLAEDACGQGERPDGGGACGGDDREAVRWVLANNQPAGLGAGSMPDLGALYVPLAGLSGTLGVLTVWPQAAGELFSAEQMHMIENLARQLGLMLEVERLEAERQRAQMEAETERLKTSLLSSVTHDFQTPLAVIMGSAESLTTVGEDLGAEQRKRLAENIRDRAGRLSRLVGNLLRMTKIESGALKPDFQLQPIDEPLGTALALLEKQLEGRPLAVDIPGDLPLVALDGTLMEQLFLNLLENVLKYTPEGSPVEIRAVAEGRNLVFSLADRGPGLAEEELDKVFNLFYQGSAAAGHTRKGHGIGLSVCRAIVQVHGGGIRAENREGGGAVFRISLPVPPDTDRTDAQADGDAKRETL